MIGGRRRGAEGTSVLRVRLIASILVAALLPFLTAWWIANTYVKQQAKANADTRLTFTARSAAREVSTVLAATRRRALGLARDRRLQRAALDRNRKAMRRLLHPGEAVVLPLVQRSRDPCRPSVARRAGRVDRRHSGTAGSQRSLSPRRPQRRS